MRIQYLGLASKKNCKFFRVVIHDKMTFTTKMPTIFLSFFFCLNKLSIAVVNTRSPYIHPFTFSTADKLIDILKFVSHNSQLNGKREPREPM